jgi:lipoyl(octanoyl) transferase
VGPFAELHVYNDADARSAAMNMAIDEALLETVPMPSLRFYCWQRPSLSFGYFGPFSDVAAEELRRDIVRRWTGGGIVLHDHDLTYSIILPGGNARRRSARVLYTEIHEAMREAFSSLNNRVALASNDAPKISGACFANPVVADVLLDGRKIAGAAQRRTRAGLLHQGSIQYESLPAKFSDAFASSLSPNFERKVLTSEVIERARTISEKKYGTAEWLRRR